MKITHNRRPVEAGLFNRKKKDDKPASMQEYLDKVNKAGNQLDKMQEKAMKKYGKVQSGQMLPGPGDYNPPEDDSEYIEDNYESYTVEMDNVVIIIDEDGRSWEYEDTSYPWAEGSGSNGDLYSDEFPDVLLSDHVGTVENVDEVIADLLPDAPGRYVISGKVELVYEIEGISVTPSRYPDEEGDYFTDFAEARFDADRSSVYDFECTSTDKDIESSTQVVASVTFDIPKSINSTRYDMYTSAQYNGVRFSVYYNSVDTSPEADPNEMFRTFKAQVSENHPYDDGNYLSARLENGVIYFAENGKSPKKKSFYLNSDAMDVENYEWCSAVVEQAIVELRELNKSVAPRMMHN